MNRSSAFPPVPADTARAANGVVAKNSAYSHLSDAMPALYELCRSPEAEDACADDAEVFLRHAVITILQLVEAYSDSQAANATRTRVEWMYALHLPMDDAGVHAYQLCLYRRSLFSNPAAMALFRAIQNSIAGLELWPQASLPSGRDAQAPSLLCRLNQTTWYMDAMGDALEALAVHDPDLLRQISLPYWYAQYSSGRGEAFAPTSSRTPMPAYGSVLRDVSYLLASLALWSDETPNQLPEVRRLRRSRQMKCDLCAHGERICVLCSMCVVGSDLAEWLSWPEPGWRNDGMDLSAAAQCGDVGMGKVG